MLLAGATIFTSCKKDEETGPAPTISFTNSVSSFEIDFATQPDPYTLQFTVTVTAEEEISTFTAKKKVSGATVNITPVPADFDGKTSYTYNYSGSFTAAETYPVELIFSCTDKADQTYEKTFTVTKHTGTAANPISTWTATLGAQSATPGSFFASSTGNIYTMGTSTANQAVIDFIYYYGSANFATICAPNDETVTGVSGDFTWTQAWTTKNATKFGTSAVTVAQFDAMTDDATISTIGTLTDTKLTNVQNGSLYAFTTAAGKKGLIKVTALTTGATGEISISVKVQQ